MIMNPWQFPDREVWSSWHVIAWNSRALVEVLKVEQIFLNFLLASALISSLFLFRKSIHLHVYVQNTFFFFRMPTAIFASHLCNKLMVSLRAAFIHKLTSSNLPGSSSLHRKSKGLWKKWADSMPLVSTYDPTSDYPQWPVHSALSIMHICKLDNKCLPHTAQGLVADTVR